MARPEPPLRVQDRRPGARKPKGCFFPSNSGYDLKFLTEVLLVAFTSFDKKILKYKKCRGTCFIPSFPPEMQSRSLPLIGIIHSHPVGLQLRIKSKRCNILKWLVFRSVAPTPGYFFLQMLYSFLFYHFQGEALTHG